MLVWNMVFVIVEVTKPVVVLESATVVSSNLVVVTVIVTVDLSSSSFCRRRIPAARLVKHLRSSTGGSCRSSYSRRCGWPPKTSLFQAFKNALDTIDGSSSTSDSRSLGRCSGAWVGRERFSIRVVVSYVTSVCVPLSEVIVVVTMELRVEVTWTLT